METYDPQKAAQVWQRVLGERPPVPSHQGLQALIMEEQTNAAAYLFLSRRFSKNTAAQLRQLAGQAQQAAACLKGICILRSGSEPAVKPLPPAQGSAEGLLRRCYMREAHCLSEYEAHAADPEYSCIYTQLAAQKKTHCLQLLTLLGGFSKSETR